MYVGVGHVTVDLLPGGSRRAGGSVVYGALAAALRGTRARIVTCAADNADALVPREVGASVELRRAASAVTTTFTNRGHDRARIQHVATPAGPVVPPAGGPLAARGDVVHLGPVAQEVDPGWLARLPSDAVVVLTPQGLVRAWPPGGGAVRARAIDPAWPDALDRPVVVVAGAGEAEWLGALGERAVAAGGVSVVTDGPRAATVRWGGGDARVAPAPVPLEDDTGAGDVFAAVSGLAIAAGAAPADAVAEAHRAVGELLPRIHALLASHASPGAG